MTDITELAQREKFEAWWKREYKHLESSKYTDAVPHIKYGFWMAYQAGGVELVEALEKAQQSVELVDLQRDKIKRLESDLWDKEQLRKVHSEKSFELEGKVRELEARNQKDFVWRGEEIGRLNDEVDELKEKLESRTVTVKLPDIMPPEAAPAHYWGSGESMAYADGYNKSAADLKTSIAQACSSAGVNVEFE